MELKKYITSFSLKIIIYDLFYFHTHTHTHTQKKKKKEKENILMYI